MPICTDRDIGKKVEGRVTWRNVWFGLWFGIATNNFEEAHQEHYVRKRKHCKVRSRSEGLPVEGVHATVDHAEVSSERGLHIELDPGRITRLWGPDGTEEFIPGEGTASRQQATRASQSLEVQGQNEDESVIVTSFIPSISFQG